MRQSLHPPPRRGGFTLVEMMVSTALIIFIMYIMASAFEKGLESFRMLKVAGDMQEQLRTASVALRNDLAKPHFGGNGDYLSNQKLNDPDWTPPEVGYFRIDFGSGVLYTANNIEEGYDPDDPTLPRTRRLPTSPTDAINTSLYPSLQFTVRLPGERRDQYFSTRHNVPNLSQLNKPDYTASEDPTIFNSLWAEVSYFVQPTGTTPGGNQLYALYRRVKVLLDANPGSLPPPVVATNDPNFANISFWRRPSFGGQRAELNTPRNVNAPQRRFGTRPNQSNGQTIYGAGENFFAAAKDVYGSGSDVAGTDLLLANVTDFEIKAQWEAPKPQDVGTHFVPSLYGPGSGVTPTPVGTVDYPFDVLPPNKNQAQRGRRVFDTWSMDEDENNPGGPEYSYGRPLDKVNKKLTNGLVPGVGRFDKTHKKLANWNAGHFNGTLNGLLDESVPIRVRITAVQIKIRIWDVKSQQSRQITLVQDL